MEKLLEFLERLEDNLHHGIPEEELKQRFKDSLSILICRKYTTGL